MDDSESQYLRRLQNWANQWEIMARRAGEGARSASKGAERLKRKVERLRDEVKILNGRIERLQHENVEQQKKISRLSLELLSRIEQGSSDVG
jgi:TolA-binding protein